MAKQKSEDSVNNELFDNYLKYIELYTQIADDTLKKTQNDNKPYSACNPFIEVMEKFAKNAIDNPELLYKKQSELFGDYMRIWENATSRYLGEKAEPLYSPDPRDKRFKDPVWNEDLAFDFLKQAYVLTGQWSQDFVENLGIGDKKEHDKVAFYTKQLLDAMCPSNFAFTNPEVIRQTIKSNGANLVDGLKNIRNDLENSDGFLNITTADKDKFKIGGNIAATKGKVVFRNELMELIQYSPATDEVYAVPLLIIPAWINKYYILDLSEDNSMVKWLTEQGYNVFMISWVNPSKDLASKKFEDYLLEGPVQAINEIERITGQDKVSAIGYCLGGTLLSCLLSYLQEKGENKIATATFLTTMIDFSNSGDMNVFIDDQQLDELDKKMQKDGFLDSSQMTAIFSALRANDLIWSFVVNNYLLGREPFPFDILYWNSDSTRLPADTHSFYLRNTYLKNRLKDPRGINLGGVDIDITKVSTPSYFLSTKEDHIAPWQTTYAGAKLLKGEVKFVLSGSGHVAGVINPPNKNKYSFNTNDKIEKSCDKWLDNSVEHQGSWWSHWSAWNCKYSGDKIKASEVKNGICDAPGSYIAMK